MRTRVDVQKVGSDPMQLGSLYYRKTYNSSWVKTKSYTYSASVHSRENEKTDICVDELHKGPPYKTGGPVDIRHLFDGGLQQKGFDDIINIKKPSTGLAYRYTGAFVCASKTLTNLGFDTSDFVNPRRTPAFGDVSSWGPTAWNKFRPGRPAADLALFIAELKDLPRMLRTTCGGILSLFKSAGGFSPNKAVRKVANHHLNTQFGWLPFLSDLRSFANAYASLDKQLQQIVRDNGRWIRRAGTLFVKDDVSVLEDAIGHCHYPGAIGLYVGSSSSLGTRRVIETTYQKVAFSAAFRYHIPDIGTDGWKKRARRKLFGASVNPALVWNATPWSWLADWCSNAGDVFANMDNNLAENLAAKYAYLMGHTRRVVTVTSNFDKLVKPSTLSWDYTMERKTREAASPFGFGLTSDVFSGRQWSILAALGLTRLGR